MTKTVSLNDFTYSELAVLAGRLSILAKKPISLGMTIAISMILSENFLNLPGAKEAMKKKFSEISPNMFTPEEFESYFEGLFKVITKENK